MAKPRPRVELQLARSYPVVVLVSVLDRRIIPAIRFVSTLPFAQPHALHISVDAAATRHLVQRWLELELTWLPLHIRDAAGGNIASTVTSVVDEVAGVDQAVTVVVLEWNNPGLWNRLVHRQRARRIAAELQATPRITTIVVPYTLH